MSATLTKAEEQSGAMVALYPSTEVAEALAQDGGEPVGDLHLTLAFLGDASELDAPDAVAQAVEAFAATAPPLTGEIAGIGHFTAGPEPVTYASPDMPGLAEFRQRLIEALVDAGAEPSSDHGFTPHITLAYEHCEPDVPNLALAFNAISLVLAGDRTDYPLTGKEAAEKGASMADLSTAPWSGDASHFTDEQWKASCILDRGGTFNTPKKRYGLPVREPDGTLNRRGLASAAAVLNGGRSGVKAPPAALSAAKTKLRRLYDDAGLPLSTGKGESTEFTVPLWKDDAKQIVYGVVMQPDVPDSAGEWQDAETIERAAHGYLAESRLHDIQHAEDPADVTTVESFIAPDNMTVAGNEILKGSWVMAVHVADPEVWGQVTKGELTGFSIGGTGVRVQSD